MGKKSDVPSGKRKMVFLVAVSLLVLSVSAGAAAVVAAAIERADDCLLQRLVPDKGCTSL